LKSLARHDGRHWIYKKFDIGKNSSTVLVATNFIVAEAPFIDSSL
jgi:hypothetical protein